MQAFQPAAGAADVGTAASQLNAVCGMRNSLLVAADSVTDAVSSLVKELNSGVYTGVWLILLAYPIHAGWAVVMVKRLSVCINCFFCHISQSVSDLFIFSDKNLSKSHTASAQIVINKWLWTNHQMLSFFCYSSFYLILFIYTWYLVTCVWHFQGTKWLVMC